MAKTPILVAVMGLNTRAGICDDNHFAPARLVSFHFPAFTLSPAAEAKGGGLTSTCTYSVSARSRTAAAE